jgi:hypothetical protein
MSPRPTNPIGLSCKDSRVDIETPQSWVLPQLRFTDHGADIWWDGTHRLIYNYDILEAIGCID